ncbi:MAG: leucine-rich repeat domain-containing protein [Bacteroidota bacterium]
MKVVLLFFSIIILNLNLLKAVSPAIILEFKSQGGSISFDLIGKSNTNITIDWGDGVTEDRNLSTQYETFTGTVQASEVKIYGGSIAGFKIFEMPLNKAVFAEYYGFRYISINNCQLDSLYLINNNELDTLFVNSNNLKFLNLEGNTSLVHLEFLSNSISSIDLGSLEKLEFLGANTNNLSCIDLSKNNLLTQIDLQYNILDSINVSNLNNLQVLALYQNQLKELDVSNNPLLTNLVCSYNLLSSVDVSKNPLLIGLGLGFNNLEELDVTKNTELTYLNVSYNKLNKEIDLSKNVKLQNLRLSGNRLPSIDLSAQSELMQLELADNLLWWIDLNSNPKLGSIDITNNDLRISYLPVPKTGWWEYYYNPQRKIEFAYKEYNTYDELDLRSEVSRDGVSSVFTWKSINGATLAPDVDYAESNGMFSFLKGQADSVYCEITNSLFPDLVLETSKFKVTGSTGTIEYRESDITISPNPFSDYLNIKSEKPIRKIEVYNYSGIKLMEYSANSQFEIEIPIVELESGFFLINVDGKFQTAVKY